MRMAVALNSAVPDLGPLASIVRFGQPHIPSFHTPPPPFSGEVYHARADFVKSDRSVRNLAMVFLANKNLDILYLQRYFPFK